MKLKNFLNEKEEDKKEDVLNQIIDFLSKNPNPPDKEIHAMSDKLKIDTPKFESYVYSILGSILGYGKAKEKNITEKDVDKKELEMGMKVEMEHTNNKAIAKRIALDHLAEMPDYYTKLAKMEGENG